jgi:predicted GIY-YIG superfamily endonuclease
MIYIYLLENLKNHPDKVYIGKTNKINRRKNAHKCNYGDNVQITIIDQIESNDKKDWVPLESYWIEQFRQWGFKLLNQNNGGGGLNTVSDVSKKKMSEAKRNFNVTWGDKISQSKKGVKIGQMSKTHLENLILSRIKNQGSPVSQIDKTTNEVLKSFDSISLAAQYIIDTTNIQSKHIVIRNGIKDCAVGRQSTSFGYKWQYLL